MHMAVGAGMVLLGLGVAIKGIRSNSNYQYVLFCVLGTCLALYGLQIIGVF